MTHQNTAVWVSLVTLIALIGCNSRPQTVGLSGQVTFDGQPVEAGKIVLEPVDLNQGQRRDVTITNGTFAISPERGVVPGDEFKVAIQAFKKTGKKYESPDPAITYEEEVQYLPAKYNSASTLRVKISADERENQLKYELTSR